MPIRSAAELRDVVSRAGVLLQEIHDYCAARGATHLGIPGVQVRFPRGFIRTATYQRDRFPFLRNGALKTNLAYTLMLSDTVLWLSIRTDLSGTAQEMLTKLYLFLMGTLIESITKDYLKGHCGKNFSGRAAFLHAKGVIDKGLEADLEWLWEQRNKMHLFQLDDGEFVNEYDSRSQVRAVRTFRSLLEALKTHGPFPPAT